MALPAAALAPVLASPALPLHSAGKYVAAAYLVFVALILVYVAIMASKLMRLEREVTELSREVRSGGRPGPPPPGGGR